MVRRLAGVALLPITASCAVSTQQEVQMGTDYTRQLEAQLPIVRDAEVNRYLTVLGDSLASIADDRGLHWRFRVVDSKEVNAFAVPGGFVYVNRGLIERTTKMDQLAGVLAHEIAHVTRRHSVQQMQKAQGTNLGVVLGCILTSICNNPAAGDMINLGGGLLFAKFSRDDESEADRVGLQTVVRAGIDPRGVPEMFRILLDERRSGSAAVGGWFSTHPLEEDRIRAAESEIAQYSPALLNTLTSDTERYQEFTRRLKSLPAVRPPRP